MRKIAIVALLFICSACFVYGKDAVGINTQDAAAAPVENYKPLETDHDVESEFKDEMNDNMDGEPLNEEEPLEDEGNAVDSNNIETGLQGLKKKLRSWYPCYYRRYICGRLITRRTRTVCSGKKFARRCYFYYSSYKLCKWRVINSLRCRKYRG